jgi:membrane-associated HD superfamily phosphohydrolase
MLHNEAKWNDKLLEVRSTPVVVKVAVAATSNVQHGNDNAPVEKPEGHDSAKRRQSREDTASSSTAVQMLQQVHDRKINTEAQQDQQMQEILIMKGDTIQLTQKMFNSQKQDMKVRSKLKEE